MTRENRIEIEFIKDKSGSKVSLIVKVHRYTSFGVSEARSIVRNAVEKKQDHIILIVLGIKEISSSSINILKDKDIKIELFFEHNFVNDIFSNPLVPFHKLLTEEEKESLLKELKIKEEQLPIIFNTDPMSKLFGAVEGQVFKVNRKSDNREYYCRVCKEKL